MQIAAVFGTLLGSLPLEQKGILKVGFLNIYLTKSLAVRNFGNTSAIRVIFFSECSKFDEDFRNAAKN